MTHICVSKLTIIGSDNGLPPDRRQAIIWTNAGIWLIRTLGTNFSEILGEIHSFSFKKMHLKMSSAKGRLFRLGLNELRGNCSNQSSIRTLASIFLPQRLANYSRLLVTSRFASYVTLLCKLFKCICIKHMNTVSDETNGFNAIKSQFMDRATLVKYEGNLKFFIDMTSSFSDVMSMRYKSFVVLETLSDIDNVYLYTILLLSCVYKWIHVPAIRQAILLHIL